MKKFKSTNKVDETQDKHYKATLLMVKMVASLSSEIRDLNSLLQEQNTLIKAILSTGKTLEEEPV